MNASWYQRSVCVTNKSLRLSRCHFNPLFVSQRTLSNFCPQISNKLCILSFVPLSRKSVSALHHISKSQWRGIHTYNDRRQPHLAFSVCWRLNNTRGLSFGQNREESSQEKFGKQQSKSNAAYALNITAAVFLFIGLAYAAAPMYKVLCQTTGMGGEIDTRDLEAKAERLASIEPVKDRPITVKFEASTNKNISWTFVPQTESIQVVPGETALAFFTATNLSNESVIGVSTYNIMPYEAASYFHKIQCFCFEDQMLDPGETVDMPVFFYIDPDFANDYKLANVQEIRLCYTFFKSKGPNTLMNFNIPFVSQPQTVEEQPIVKS